MEATGIVQTTLARDLGISQGHISKLVSRKEQPSMTLAAKIHRRYGVAMEGLIKRPRTSKAA
jgi:transcriptional regulator with XRE-family HTH domain